MNGYALIALYLAPVGRTQRLTLARADSTPCLIATGTDVQAVNKPAAAPPGLAT